MSQSVQSLLKKSKLAGGTVVENKQRSNNQANRTIRRKQNTKTEKAKGSNPVGQSELQRNDLKQNYIERVAKIHINEWR